MQSAKSSRSTRIARSREEHKSEVKCALSLLNLRPGEASSDAQRSRQSVSSRFMRLLKDQDHLSLQEMDIHRERQLNHFGRIQHETDVNNRSCLQVMARNLRDEVKVQRNTFVNNVSAGDCEKFV